MMPLPASIKASAQYFDREYKPDNTKNNRLSIQLRLDGFSFCQVDNINQKVLSIQDYQVPLMLGDEAVYQSEKVLLRLESLLKNSATHLKTYKSIHFIIDNQYYTLVPSALYSEESLSDYLKTLFLIPDDFIIKSQYISQIDSYCVYAVYAPLFYLISDSFPQFELSHSCRVFIQQMASIQKGMKGNAVYADIGANEMRIIAFNNDQLLFSNSFAFKEKEDFIYFILLVYNQLNFAPESVPLLFSGNIDRSSDLYAIAYQYIGILDFPKASDSGLVFGNDIPEHLGSKYRVLTQAVLCE